VGWWPAIFPLASQFSTRWQDSLSAGCRPAAGKRTSHCLPPLRLVVCFLKPSAFSLTSPALRDLPYNSPQSGPGRGYSGSHQRAWLWGRHAVLETLTAARWPVLELFTSEALAPDALRTLQEAAGRQSVPWQRVSSARLEQLCRQADHQGVAARMGEFPAETAADLSVAVREAALAWKTNATALATAAPAVSFAPLFVMLDRIQDPWNFGAILRCCDAVSAAGIVIGMTSQSTITPHVARASSGAVNYLRIFQTPDLAETTAVFRKSGFRIAVASEKSSDVLWNSSLAGPLLLIIGSEAHGVAPRLLECSDVRAAIPMLGRVTSLNAAAAAGILLYECRRQSGTSPAEPAHAD
jgi:23S rRNA (guanosine2251-2'-O)-methyltransferase